MTIRLLCSVLILVKFWSRKLPQRNNKKWAVLKTAHLRKKQWIYKRKSPENQWFSGLGGGDKRDRTADLLNAICSEANFSPLRRWLLAIQAPFCHTILMNFQKQNSLWSTKLYLLLTRFVKGKKRVRTSFCVLLQPVK